MDVGEPTTASMAGHEPIDGLVERVRGEPDPVRRNRLITRGYHSLGMALAQRLGRQDATWPHFGAWASASAGRFIRGEVGPLPLGRDAVAAGNLLIITDVAPRFLRFLAICDAVAAHERRDAVLTDPTLTASAATREAFLCYARAADLRDDPSRDHEHAELVLLGNLLIAHHEQLVADPTIDAAIPLGGPAGILATRLVSILSPDGDIDVCRDVPRPAYLGGAQWPPTLEHLTNDRLLALFDAYGQDVTDTRHSDAPSWEAFHERMGFIACYFRAYQRDPAILDGPPEMTGARDSR